MVLGIHEEQKKYTDVIRANQTALDIHIGQKIRINKKEFTVIEKYPHIIRIRAKDGETMTLNKGDLVQYRTKTDDGPKRNGGRALVCLTDGRRYRSSAELARETKMPQPTVWRKIDNMELIDGKLYRWAE